MSDQIDFFSNFGDEDEKNNKFKILEETGDNRKNFNFFKCYRTELKKIEFKTLDELFYGFDMIQVITFSYNIDFISKIMSNFEYGEIILGAEHIYYKDKNLNEILAETLTNVQESSNRIGKYSNLVKMITEEDLNFHVSTSIVDHRKIYLLRTDDKKRTRVIITSANLSKTAWDGSQMETISYDDTIEAYDEYEKDFETAWNDSQEIPASIFSSKHVDDLIDGNAILNAAKKKITSVTVVQKNEDPDYLRFCIDHEKIKEQYKKYIKGTNIKAKDGVVELKPEHIKKLNQNKEKILEAVNEENNTLLNYPKMHIDYERKQVYINDKLIDLNPTDDEVRADIKTFLNMFENYNDFVCDTDKLKDTHFKLLNALFCSPFNAKIRCAFASTGVANNSSLPMVLIISSTNSNCGKSFMVSAAIKMMTGVVTEGINRDDASKKLIEYCQNELKSVPFFIDELDNTFLAQIIDIIKNPQKCENRNNEEQPMIVFASNYITEPNEIIRRRSIFLRYEGGLPSDFDRSAYKGKGNAIIRKLGTAFYRIYLKIMIDKIIDEIEYIINSKNIPDEYYPDVMRMSSETIIQIFKNYGCQIPKYMRKLCWNDDYSENAKYIFEDSIEKILKLYEQDPETFKITNENITINYGSSKESQRRIESLRNTLPIELNAEVISTRDSCKLIIDRKEFEKIIGFKLKRKTFFKKRR